jgi:2-phosphoglycerate kinase
MMSLAVIAAHFIWFELACLSGCILAGMNRPTLILVSGPVASGKTVVSERLSRALSIPVYSRDMFKELMFDSLGWEGDQEWLDAIGYVANENLFQIMRREMAVGRPVIIENVFHPHIYNPILQAMYAERPFRALQINAWVDPAVLRRRFESRTAGGTWHPGHARSLQNKRYREILERGSLPPLDLEGKVIRVDNTNDVTAAMGRVIAEVREYLDGE